MKNKNLLNIFLSMVCLLIVGLGCSSIGGGEKAVDKFHTQWNEGNFAAIYDQATVELKNSMSKEAFVNGLRNMQNRYGKVVATNSNSWEVKTINDTTIINLVNETQFSKSTAIEKFQFVEVDDELKLTLYNLAPKN